MITMNGDNLTLEFDHVCTKELDPSSYQLVITGPPDKISVSMNDGGQREIRVHGYAEAKEFLNACGLIFELTLKTTKD